MGKKIWWRLGADGNKWEQSYRQLWLRQPVGEADGNNGDAGKQEPEQTFFLYNQIS